MKKVNFFLFLSVGFLLVLLLVTPVVARQDLAIEQIKLSVEENHYYLSFDLKNNSRKIISPDILFEISDTFGRQLQKFEVRDEIVVAPESVQEISADWDGSVALIGKVKARLTVTDKDIKTVYAHDFWLIPQTLTVIAAAVFLAAGVFSKSHLTKLSPYA